MGGGGGRAASIGTRNHGLSGMVRKQTNTSRPPTFMPLRILVKALIGSSKNITPNRE